jgi:hypothetical protein
LLWTELQACKWSSSISAHHKTAALDLVLSYAPFPGVCCIVRHLITIDCPVRNLSHPVCPARRHSSGRSHRGGLGALGPVRACQSERWWVTKSVRGARKCVRWCVHIFQRQEEKTSTIFMRSHRCRWVALCACWRSDVLREYAHMYVTDRYPSGSL